MNRGPDINLNRPSVYVSAIDLWIATMLLMTPFLAGGIGVYAWLQGEPAGAMILFLVGAVAALVTLALTLPCRYTILDDALSIRCGILCYQIPLAEIEDVQYSTTWRSGPALSMRRVLITTKKREVIVSPRDRDEFIGDLYNAIEHHRRSGNE